MQDQSINLNNDRALHCLKHNVQYREFQPQDIEALKFLHNKIFPIDYDHSFFQHAVDGNGIVGWAAVIPQHLTLDILPDPTTVLVNGMQIVGFITAKCFSIDDVPLQDKTVMDFNTASLSSDISHPSELVYILTLGVVPRFRHLGIASSLLNTLESHAKNTQCLGLYLHVISYNTPAQQFYNKAGFQYKGELQNFYHIRTGRALHADRFDYDASLLLKLLDNTPDNGHKRNENGNNTYTSNTQSGNILWYSYLQQWWSKISRYISRNTPLLKRKKLKRSEDMDVLLDVEYQGQKHQQRPFSAWLRRLFGANPPQL